MIILTRGKILFLGAAVLALAAGGVFGLSYGPEIAAWLGRGAPAAPPAAGEPAGHDMAAMEQPGERQVLYWYDPMHPAYKSDKPGIAPDCGMQLVPKYAEEMEAMKEMPAGTVQISPAKQQLIGVRTATVESQRVTRTLRTVGRVGADETKIARIHVKVAGWVEEVYVDFVGKLVEKGQPLFNLYSPELVSAQKEYLIARRAESYLGQAPYAEAAQGSEALLRAARERLKLWDVTDEQLQKLGETGEASRTITLYSPITGFVMKRNLFPRVYVTPESELYELADLSTIWVNADIYEYEVPYVRLGQPARMWLSYFPGKAYTGTVSYIYPTLDPQTRTVKVRLEFPNPELQLKPDMFAEVELSIDYGTHLAVPQEAVLDAGTEQVVFLAHADGYFEPRRVKLGARVDDKIIVLEGLRPGDTIVTSGNFLIDSESRLKSAMEGMKH